MPNSNRLQAAGGLSTSAGGFAHCTLFEATCDLRLCGAVQFSPLFLLKSVVICLESWVMHGLAMLQSFPPPWVQALQESWI
jgi:hypothetical protein